MENCSVKELLDELPYGVKLEKIEYSELPYRARKLYGPSCYGATPCEALKELKVKIEKGTL